MSTPDTISLTDDIEQQAKLRRKLEEYDARLQFQAPEVDPHATYKQRVLAELLEDGSVDVCDLRSREQECSWYHAPSFDDAVNLIAAYNANDLRRVYGGSGLH